MTNKIPKNFKSIKEEANFWDNHDIGNFIGTLKVVKGYDISTSSLIRMWMVDKLRTFSH